MSTRHPSCYAKGPLRLRTMRHGAMLYNPLDVIVGRSLEMYGEYAEGAIGLLRSVVEPGMAVIEVGAHIGAHTVFLAQAVGASGRVFAFEPQRMAYQNLNANLALNDLENVVSFPFALGDQPGVARIPVLTRHAVHNSAELALMAEEGEPVNVAPFDQYGFSEIQFIKISACGGELPILTGATETLESCQPVLYLDAPASEEDPDYKSFLVERGYRLFRHDVSLFNPLNFFECEENAFGDALLRRVFALPAKVAPDFDALPQL
ncbi:MAG: FkbM family methyltransferase [Puniceicoccales bacterium]